MPELNLEVRWLAVIAACGVALIAAGEGRAENRGQKTLPSASKSAERSTGSKSADDAKVNDEFADDDSIKDRPGDKSKNPKARKKKSDAAKPGAAGSSGRGRPGRVITERTPVMSGGGGGFIGET